MNTNRARKISLFASVALHSVVIFLMFIIEINLEYEPVEYVEIGFGSSGVFGSSGASGSEVEAFEEEVTSGEEETAEEELKEVKDVDLPEIENPSDESDTAPAGEDKEQSEKSEVENPDEEKDDEGVSKSKGNVTSGSGSLGYAIDWGGTGERKLIFHTLPEYPAGVNKEIDIRLRFTILPDGSVGSVFPLTKADTKLENAAINALKKWKFASLSSRQKKTVQQAIIVFPYRLR